MEKLLIRHNLCKLRFRTIGIIGEIALIVGASFYYGIAMFWHILGILLFLSVAISLLFIFSEKNQNSLIGIIVSIAGLGLLAILWDTILKGSRETKSHDVSFVILLSLVWLISVWIISKIVKSVQNKQYQKIQAMLEEEKLRQEQELREHRAKIEEERQRQDAIKQQEYRLICERYVNEFWNEYLDSTEDTDILLARLRFKFEKSGYRNWHQEFYADVEKRANETSRPPQEQREKTSVKETDFDCFGNLLIDFNGVFVTPEQYQILSQTTKTRNLSRAQVLELCRKLAETRPEFASFKEERGIQPYVAKEETNEAFRLFGLTSESLNAESLKQAYRRLVQQYHPDRNREPNTVEMFQKVQRYYAYLESLARC